MLQVKVYYKNKHKIVMFYLTTDTISHYDWLGF